MRVVDMCICAIWMSHKRHKRHRGGGGKYSMSDPSGLSWSMTQSGSTPQQGQPECGKVNLPSRYPWIARESPRKSMSQHCSLCYTYIYIYRLCVAIRVKGLLHPRSQTGSMIQRVTCPLSERTQTAEKMSDETGDVGIDALMRRGKGGERTMLRNSWCEALRK